MQAPDWDEPLPHALQPAYAYLSRPSAQTRAAVVLMHGRGDNAPDFADAFLPALRRCFGGSEERLEEGEQGSGDVAVVSLAAADGIWYPESHSVTSPEQLEYNGPYVYSALQRLQQTLLELAASGVPPSRVVVAGFSQGANLANTYMLCALREPESAELPRPAYVLALAGTRLASLPPFPQRAGTFGAAEASRSAPPSSAVPGAEHTFARLVCGEGDRYFRPAEIHAVAAELAQAGVRVSVALEPGLGHIVSPRMVAAVIEAAQQLCAEK